jgi:hypothetical protein
VVDDSDPEVESDLRRRAAWLLLMLAIVAVLLVVVISALVSTHSSGNDNTGPKALDPAATETGGPQQGPAGQHSAHHRRHHPQQGGSSSSSAGTGTSSVPVASTTCSGSQTCILDGDPGNAIQAINDFRTAHGLPAVPGSVTPQAQTCALNNGNGCTGGWAETLLSDPNGEEAVQKIEQYAHFEDPQLKSIEVGWAYDPSAQLYYFAIVRND